MVTLPKFTGSSVGPTVPVPIWLVIGAGALTIRFLRDITRPKPPNREKDVEKAFVVTVNLTFNNEADRDKYIDLWRPLAEHVSQNEPKTLAFEFCIGRKDPSKCLILERYISKEAYLEVHKTSAAYLQYKAATAALGKRAPLISNGTSFLESNIGYFA